jgi:hypothetical protein
VDPRSTLQRLPLRNADGIDQKTGSTENALIEAMHSENKRK